MGQSGFGGKVSQDNIAQYSYVCVINGPTHVLVSGISHTSVAIPI